MTQPKRGVAEFSVASTFSADRAVLEVRGEVDDVSAPVLRAYADAAIASGYPSVVLDLAELDFVNGAGLTVIVGTANRLAAAGGRLTIRSASAMVRRLLDITRVSDLVLLEQPEPERLGVEQPSANGLAGRRRGERRSSSRRIAFIPVGDDVVDGALRLVVALAKDTVGGADGVSVSLRRHGRLSTVAASDQTILAMDADQYEAGEGPCVDASVTGRWFHAASLATETRWPTFTPRARTLGIHAILSSPLLAQDRPVGALNIYSRTEAAFAPRDQARAAVFASEASTILTTAGADVSDAQLSRRLAEALRTRQIIAQAEGVMMERGAIDEERAYSMLVESSVRSGTPLKSQAEEVVASARRGHNGRGPASSEGPDDLAPT